MADQIRYHALKPSEASLALPKILYQQLERALMVAAIACAIISLVPSLSTVGALSLRTVSGSIVGIKIAHALKNNAAKGQIVLLATYAASIALGLFGVAAHLNGFVIASLAVTIALQALEAGRGTNQKDLYKAFGHASYLLIDTFTMIALLNGGIGFVITAASLNCALMLTFGIKEMVDATRHRDYGAAFDAACFFTLCGIGIGSSARPALPPKFTKAEFPTLPVGPAAVATKDLQLDLVQPDQPVHEVIEDLRGYATRPEYRFHIWETADDPYDRLQLIGPEERKVTLIKSQACKLSTSLNALRSEHNDKYQHLTPKICPILAIHLNYSTAVFEKLVDFFQTGRLAELEKIEEALLLELYNAADDLQMGYLRHLIQSEVAQRLRHFEWRDTTLFAPYFRYERPITKFLKLFDFTKLSTLESLF